MAGRKETIIKQTKTFWKRFYRFPSYIYVGNEKVHRDEIIRTVEQLIDAPFVWYKRRRIEGQLDDALRRLQC